MKNILIIMGDQHRYDCIGAYGNKDIKTPYLDSIAEDGVLYKEHYTTYPVCTPARYSLLTGLYTHQHMGWGNHCTLAEGLPTYSKELRKKGYKTVAVGKMHATPTYLDLGFDKMILAEQDGDGRYDDDYHKYLMEKGVVDKNDIIDQRQEFRKKADKVYWETNGAMVSNLDEKHHSTTWITERALEELDGWIEGGNLMLVSYVKPHHPFDPPAPYDVMYDPSALELLPGYTQEVPEVDYEYSQGYFDHKTLSEVKLRRIMAHYYGSITHMDYHIGRIIQSLKEKGLYEDTLIVYTSDHGEYMGFHHMLLKTNYMYDPLVKIPLIIKYPENIHKGSYNENISNNTDIATTILKQVGVPVPMGMKGIDLADQTAGRQITVCEGIRVDHSVQIKPLYYEYMVRSKDYKLIISRNFKHYRFFDMKKDPLEMQDVAADAFYAIEIEKHKTYLAQMLVFEDLSISYINYDEKLCNEKYLINKQQSQKVREYFEIELSSKE